MELTRRAFNAILIVGGTVALIPLEGCSLASALTEADNILILIAPLGDGVAAIVEIVDPAIAPAVIAADKIYDLALIAVENLLTEWAAASAAAQPGILAQAEEAIVTLQQDAQALIAAAQVKGAAAMAEITAIFGAVLGEIAALLKIIPQIGGMGGTTVALNAAAKSGKLHFKGPLARSVRASLVNELSTPTGQPMDAARTELAQKLDALQLK
jgi:hypothetical protein